MINRTPDFPMPTGKHNSELNVLRLTCDVVAKPIQRTPGIAPDVQSPVLAYLSSDMLDKCVQSVGQFPTTDQFIQYMNERMIEKAAAFSAPAPPPPPPPASAPPLSEIDGGRKNTRRKAKKNKNVRRSHRH
jgi:cell division septation protein DedD